MMCFRIPLSSAILAVIICILGFSSADITSDFFPELPPKFQVQVLGFNIINKTSFYVTEVYDQDLKKGVVKVTGINKKYTIMYNFNQGRAIKIDGTGRCAETNITESGAFVFEDAHHLSLGGMVGLFPQLSPQGPAMINGIQCDSFKAENIYVPSFDANGTVELMWTKPGLNNFANCPALKVACVNWTVPIELSVNGTINRTKKPYKFVYSFYDFQEHVDELATFELPPGTFCTNLKNNPGFPAMEARFYTGLEMVTKGSAIYNFEFYVRREGKVGTLRIDVDSFELFTNNDNAIDEKNFFRTVIVDIETAAYYSIDTRKGSCKVFSIAELNDDFKDMELIINFLMNDNILNYTYMGLRLNRNRLAEVWSALGYSQKTLNEYYFVETEKMSESQQNVQKVYVPLAINISEYSQAEDQIKIGNSTQFNFFNFFPYTPKWSEFDISPCFNGQFSLRFQMKFRQMGVNTVPMDGKEEIFEDALINYFKNELNVSPIRFQKIKIDSTKDGVIYFMTTLLENPPDAGIKLPFPHYEKTNRELYDYFDQESLDGWTIPLQLPGVMDLFIKLEEVRKLISGI